MDAPGAPLPTGNDEREHLAQAHDEIRTALTVLRSNVDLVRIHLRDAQGPGSGTPVNAHLDELEDAVERLRDVARKLKRWHDGIPPRVGDGPARMTAKQAESRT